MANPNTQIAKTQPAPVAVRREIKDWLQSDAVKRELALALPKHITADRMARVALTAAIRTPKLLQCTRESLFSCLMQCSQLGLEPDGRRAHLIPFENKHKGTTECTLIIDWKGLAELALRSGMIARLHADLICANDKFEFDMGEILHHKIDFKQDRGEPYAAYSLAETKTGEKFVQVMTKAEIEKIRDNSQGWRAFKSGYAKQSPWQDSPGEMWKKTTFRRLAKWLPLSPEFRDALDVDDEELPKVETEPATSRPIFNKPEDLPALPEGEPEPEPPAAIETQAESTPAESNPVEEIRDLLKLGGVTDAEIMDYLHATGAEETLGSLEDVQKIDAERLAALKAEWPKHLKEINKLKKAGKK